MKRRYDLCLPGILVVTALVCGMTTARAESQGTGLSEAVVEAQEVGVPSATLNRILTLGYERQLDPVAMGKFLVALSQAQREAIPLQPLVSKIEEGLAKKVPASRIVQVVDKKLDDYRFVRSLLDKHLSRFEQDEPVSPAILSRLAESLYCGVSREDMAQLLEQTVGVAHLSTFTRGVEVLSALKQVNMDQNLSRQIAVKGIRQGYFTPEQREFAATVAAAKRKGLSDRQIADAALDALETRSSPAELQSRLGVSQHEASMGPRFGSPPGRGEEGAKGVRSSSHRDRDVEDEAGSRSRERDARSGQRDRSEKDKDSDRSAKDRGDRDAGRGARSDSQQGSDRGGRGESGHEGRGEGPGGRGDHSGRGDAGGQGGHGGGGTGSGSSGRGGDDGGSGGGHGGHGGAGHGGGSGGGHGGSGDGHGGSGGGSGGGHGHGGGGGDGPGGGGGHGGDGGGHGGDGGGHGGDGGGHGGGR